MALSAHDVLLLVAAEANSRGMLVPQLGTEQARQAAERLLAAVGLTHVEPRPELTSAPAPLPQMAPSSAPPAVGATTSAAVVRPDDATMLLPVIDSSTQRRFSRQRGNRYETPVRDTRYHRGSVAP